MAVRPTTTQAAILVAQHEPLVVDTIELPRSLDVGQVLVELQCSGICGSQLGEIDGVKGPDRYLPHLVRREKIKASMNELLQQKPIFAAIC